MISVWKLKGSEGRLPCLKMETAICQISNTTGAPIIACLTIYRVIGDTEVRESSKIGAADIIVLAVSTSMGTPLQTTFPWEKGTWTTQMATYIRYPLKNGTVPSLTESSMTI